MFDRGRGVVAGGWTAESIAATGRAQTGMPDDPPPPPRAWFARILLGLAIGIVCFIIGLIVLSGAGALMLLVGFVFDLRRTEVAGQDVLSFVVRVLRVVAMIGTPVLASVTLGSTVYVASRFLQRPGGCLAALVTLGALTAGVVLVLAASHTAGWIVGLVLTPVSIMAAGLVSTLVSTVVSHTGQNTVTAGVERMEPGEPFVLLLGTGVMWAMTVALAHWLGWIHVTWPA
ncbi:MAG: hypothetical protein HRU70_14360 [Phycisphaeraceae bacterium]|nr:MAG: hypothetical protein HRU70_14360 [Phycisphaeraceae bacterium]